MDILPLISRPRTVTVVGISDETPLLFSSGGNIIQGKQKIQLFRKLFHYGRKQDPVPALAWGPTTRTQPPKVAIRWYQPFFKRWLSPQHLLSERNNGFFRPRARQFADLIMLSVRKTPHRIDGAAG